MNEMRELTRPELAQVEGGMDGLGGILDIIGIISGGLPGLVQEFVLKPILDVVNGFFNQIVDAITDFVTGIFG